MLFRTIEEYDKELKEMEIEIEDIKEYLKKHPEQYGTLGNFKTMKELYEIFKQDKIDFIQDVNDMNLKLKGDQLQSPLTSTQLNTLGQTFKTVEHAMTNLLTKNNPNEDLLIKCVSLGSYNIKFAFQNPTEDDVTRKSPRKQGLVKLFDYIKCGDDIEKRGRLDILLQDDDQNRYEVEIQLGSTDPSHIIRTIEYWDTEKKRYPQYDHCAVIVAEEITGRFMNVISLFNGSIPLIALQLSAFQTGDDISLVFTKIIDRIDLSTDEEEELVTTDRNYWENTKSTPHMMKLVDSIYDDLGDLISGYELK